MSSRQIIFLLTLAAIFVVSVGVAVDGVPTKKEGGLASRLP